MNRSTVTLCGTHLAGNAFLLWIGYYWLGIGEPDAVHLILSAAVILFFAIATVWLHGTALVLFGKEDAESGLLAAGGRALRNILPLLLLGIAAILIYVALQYAYDSFGHEAFVLGSYSTMKLRRPVAPDNVLRAFHGFIWMLRWIVVPVFFLPLASQVANRGWGGFARKSLSRSRSIWFWIEVGLLLVAAVLLPLQLFFWVPKVSSFSMEVVSVTLRLGLGYLLFTFGLLAVEFVTAAGNPRSTQPRTVASP